METVYAQMTEDGIDRELIRRAGEILRGGGLVAFPTETVYGLGGDAFNPESSKKIYAAKGRPSDNPLIVHICRLEDLGKVAREVPPQALRLAEAFWPGPLTMILPKRPELPPETTGGLDTVAIRFPSNRIALELIRAAGGFVAAPSANRSGRPSPTLARYCREDLDGRVEMIIDGGQVGLGLESTIIDLTEEKPAILRPGFVTPQDLEDVLGEEVLGGTEETGTADAGTADTGTAEAAAGGSGKKREDEKEGGAAPKAPGMKYRHYAPRGRLTVVEGPREETVRLINRKICQARAEGLLTGVICTEETKGLYEADLVKSVGFRKDEASIARELFRVLREFDDEGAQEIYAESFGGSGLGAAVMNRLLKAAGHHVLHT